MQQQLQPHQFALLKALADPPAEPTIEALAEASGTDQALIAAAAVELAEAGVVVVSEEPYHELKLGKLGSSIGAGTTELPERTIVRAVAESGGSASIKELSGHAKLKEAGIHPGKLARKVAELGWAEFDKGTLSLADTARDGEPPVSALEQVISSAAESGGMLSTLAGTTPELEQALVLGKGRKELFTLKERSRRLVALTPAGEELAAQAASGEVSAVREVNELTPEMLLDGSWQDATFREYDVTLAAEQVTPGKAHPLQRVIDRTRLAFMEMGFTEVNCPMAELAFWDFDALFQPQDHPAREMQDTFYCKTPASYSLPPEELVERVRRTHEDGWETGSRGWRYEWSPQRAAQVVLRTHMTASSIEAIHRNPEPPQKIVSIGRVFRRETVDYKHLPEFYQVDGIIIDHEANFSSLLGTLRKFYERLGVPDVQFKPDFFPYTEPSVGVQIQWNGKWFEMGGAGVFRPEVTRPFGCEVPVLAWGLGLERLAMAIYGVPVIKDLYLSNLEWLKNVPLSGS